VKYKEVFRDSFNQMAELIKIVGCGVITRIQINQVLWDRRSLNNAIQEMGDPSRWLKERLENPRVFKTHAQL
jgi:hypothetical protein